MDDKEIIKERVSIIDVAALYLNLQPAGSNYKSLCPFHQEKTASFIVYPDKNTYKCYGCHVFGDQISLVQEMENLSFPEAIHFLADKFAIQLPGGGITGKSAVNKVAYQDLNEIALGFFQEQLRTDSRETGEFFRRRGIKAETVSLFSLGLAPADRDALWQFLDRKGCKLEKAVELGLVQKKEKRSAYDRFRNRIVFPIFSETGKIVAFGGRALGDSGPGNPKYLNSPETPVYRKGDHLFALHLAKEFIRREKSLILVEGYMDQISLFQAGFKNTVASLGTALTEKQVYLLKRFASSVFIFYDSDEAGQEATQRSLEKAFMQGVFPRVVDCGVFKDPDEMVRNAGPEAVAKALEQAPEAIDFLLCRATAKYNLSRPQEKSAAYGQVNSILEKIPDEIVRNEFLMAAADYFQVEYKPAARTGYLPENSFKSVGPLQVSVAEMELLRALIARPDFLAEIKCFFTPELLSILAIRNIIACMFEYDQQEGDFPHERLSAGLDVAERALYADICVEMSGVDVIPDIEDRISNAVVSLQNKLNKKKLNELNRLIRNAEKEKNHARLLELMGQKNSFVRSLKCSREENIEQGVNYVE